MKVTEEHNQKIANMTVASVYPHYVAKVIRKGRSIEELQQVIEWLTGFDAVKLNKLLEKKVNFEEFFEQAKIHPNAVQIKGLICGYRIEEIEHPLTRNVRYLDKLVDELAKGKKLEKILRSDS